jgi:hypothetical protein
MVLTLTLLSTTIELESRPKKKKRENFAFYGSIDNFGQIVSDIQKRGDQADEWTEKDLSTSNSKKNLILWEEGFLQNLDIKIPPPTISNSFCCWRSTNLFHVFSVHSSAWSSLLYI